MITIPVPDSTCVPDTLTQTPKQQAVPSLRQTSHLRLHLDRHLRLHLCLPSTSTSASTSACASASRPAATKLCGCAPRHCCLRSRLRHSLTQRLRVSLTLNQIHISAHQRCVAGRVTVRGGYGFMGHHGWQLWAAAGTVGGRLQLASRVVGCSCRQHCHTGQDGYEVEDTVIG